MAPVIVHFWAFVGISAVVILAPGPDTVVVTKNAIVHGRGAALATSLGVNAGLLVWTLAAALGVAAVVRESAVAFTALKLIGAAYLVWLGGQALLTAGRRPAHARLAGGDPGQRIGPLTGFRQGLLSDLSNPKIAVFFTGLLSQFVAPRQPVLAPFLALGVTRDGEYQQLSGNALQIENEYYSYVRPKRTLRAGERTTAALARAGVEYVEVRALDNSAFDAVGVNLRKLHFLEALLIMLLFKASPPIDGVEEQAIERNHLAVARHGREPALNLERDGRRVSMRSWGAELLESMQGICELLDAAHPQRPYVAALREQRLKLEEVEHTPSARLLRELRAQQEGFAALALRVSREHKEYCLQGVPFAAERARQFEAEVQQSLQQYAALEAAPRGSFEDYLASYLAD